MPTSLKNSRQTYVFRNVSGYRTRLSTGLTNLKWTHRSDRCKWLWEHCVRDCVTELSKSQSEAIQSLENVNVRNTRQGETPTQNVRGLNWQQPILLNCTNSSRADSRVNCLKTSDVSEIHSVSNLRESDITFPEDGDSVSLKRRRLLIRSLSLRMETECLWNVGGF
jgi:hypothetical protein